jgi:hypothetical protein
MGECIALIRGNGGRHHRRRSGIHHRRKSLAEEWSPDALAITSRAAYLWCSAGILDSKVNQAFARNAGAGVTTRNWATVLKLQAAAKGG